MPKIPRPPVVDCHIPVNASEDIKLKILEEKLRAEFLIGETFTTNVAVGNLPAGTEIQATDNIRDILLRILYADKVLISIAITHAPNKVVYTAGESFNPAGMIVTGTYNDGTSEVITNYTYSPSGALATTDTKITVSYSEKTAEQAITVNAPVSEKIYKGIVDSIPTTITGLTAVDVSKEALLADGYLFKNITTNNQFAVVAVPKTLGLICYEITVSGFAMSFIQKDLGEYYLYHFENPTTESAARYTYKFEEAE